MTSSGWKTVLAAGILALSALSTLSTATAATTYRVGPGRSFTQPTAVVGLLQPGDIVEVDGNATYNPVKFTDAGTAAAPITVRGIVPPGGRRPILSGGVNTLQLEISDHMIVEDFEVTGGTNRCVFVHAHNITLRRLLVRDCPSHGILGADTESGDLLIEDSEVTRIATQSINDQKHAIYLSSDLALYPNAVVTVRNTFVHDNARGNGIKTRAGRNNIYYNWVETQGSFYPLQVNGSQEYECKIGPTQRGCNADVVGNVFIAHGDAYLSFGDGTGDSRGRMRLVNNTFLGNDFAQYDSVVRIVGEVDSIELHNNIFHLKNGNQAMKFIRDQDAVWLRGQRTIVGSHNLITLNPADSIYNGQDWLPTGLTQTVYALPSAAIFQRVDFANPALMDLRIVAGSLARNIGQRSGTSLPGFEISNPLALPTQQPALTRPAPGQFTLTPRPAATDMAGAALPAAISAGAFEFAQANDVVPDPFAFIAQTGVAPSTTITSNPAQITGINAPAAVSVGNGTFAVVAAPNCTGATFGTTGTVQNAQYVCLRHTSAALPNSVTSTTLTIGGVSATFSSTTASATQTISFTNPGAQTFSAAPIALVASATSGLPVVFATTTPVVCTVVGTSAIMKTAGTCTIRANQPGNGAYLPAAEVVQSFNIAAALPGAPAIGSVIAGNTQAVFSLTPPASSGGAPILTYTVTCDGVSASGNAQPILLGGLTNGVQYSCSATATTVIGTGPASAVVTVTPDAAAALTLVGVKSRKSHAAAGTHDLTLATAPAIGGNVSVEPRLALPGHTIVFQFNNPITQAGSATVVDAAMTALTVPPPAASGSEVIVTLGAISGGLDGKRVKISLTSVNGVLSPQVSLGFLAGDVNGLRAVNAADISGIKARLGQSVRADNFLLDIDASGVIDQADVTATKARSGSVLP